MALVVVIGGVHRDHAGRRRRRGRIRARDRRRRPPRPPAARPRRPRRPPPRPRATSTTEEPTTSAPATSAPATAAPTTAAHRARRPRPADPFASARIRLVRIVSLDYPIAMAVRPSDGSLWIARKGGAVCRLTGTSCTLSQVVASVSTGSEQGLLGIAFNPSGSRFYASYTNPAGDTRVDEFPVRANGTADVAQPPQHLRRGPARGEPQRRQHRVRPRRSALPRSRRRRRRRRPARRQRQRPEPEHRPRQDPAHRPRRPDRAAVDQRRAQPVAVQLRPRQRRLWVADVGQDSGRRSPTSRPARSRAATSAGGASRARTGSRRAPRPAGTPRPIHEYAHGPGCSITGGYVYRGSKIPALVGAYLFADYCDGQIRGFTISGGRVRTLRAPRRRPRQRRLVRAGRQRRPLRAHARRRCGGSTRRDDLRRARSSRRCTTPPPRCGPRSTGSPTGAPPAPAPASTRATWPPTTPPSRCSTRPGSA